MVVTIVESFLRGAATLLLYNIETGSEDMVKGNEEEDKNVFRTLYLRKIHTGSAQVNLSS